MRDNERLRAIRKRLDEATPAPWESAAIGRGPTWIVGDVSAEGAVDIIRLEQELVYSEQPRAYDVDLIVNAPADLAFLLGEVDRLTEQIQIERNHYRNMRDRHKSELARRDERWKRIRRRARRQAARLLPLGVQVRLWGEEGVAGWHCEECPDAACPCWVESAVFPDSFIHRTRTRA